MKRQLRIPPDVGGNGSWPRQKKARRKDNNKRILKTIIKGQKNQ
jgi:hypothetical protein